MIGNLTPFAKQAIKEMSSHGYRMEYFRDAELLVDITEHKLVPGENTVLCSVMFYIPLLTLLYFILAATLSGKMRFHYHVFIRIFSLKVSDSL